MSSNKYFTADPNSSKGSVADFRHASSVFVKDNYALAPKTKYLYHVVFNFNPLAVASFGIKKDLLSVLVKSVELPKFTIQTDTLNQYNRKRISQVKVDYIPVNLRFHDDNSDAVRNLWEIYFKYHFNDSTNAEFSATRLLTYSRNAMDDVTGRPAKLGFRYGYDTGNLTRFFLDITIYQMSRQKWSSYTLVNPTILSWNHDSLDSSSNQPAEQSMSIGYEAVGYDEGDGTPKGFPTGRYDQVKSPLVLGSSGSGGSANSVAERYPPKLQTAVPNSTTNTLNTQNAYTRNNPVTATGLQNNLANTVSTNTSALTATNVNGIKDISFPVNTVKQTVKATQVKLF